MIFGRAPVHVRHRSRIMFIFNNFLMKKWIGPMAFAVHWTGRGALSPSQCHQKLLAHSLAF
jgi:hypothetical protein